MQRPDASHPIPIPCSEALDVDIEEVIPTEEFVAVGEGAERYRDKIQACGGNIPLDALRAPALEAAQIAWMLREEAKSPLQISLDYIRPPDAIVPKNLGQALGRPQI